MKNIPHYLLCVVLLMFVFTGCKRHKSDFSRRLENFDQNWLFHLGDVTGGEKAGYNDNLWRTIDLPHDWTVEMPFSREQGTTANGQTAGGTGWYRKSFILRPEDKDKLHRLYFEGAYMETDIWLNGQHIGNHPYGYTSFFCDLTPYCLPAGEKNILAVKVKNEGKNSRWYSGSGIYRHVWFESVNRLHLDTWGLFVTTPDVSQEKALVKIAADAINETGQEKDIKVQILIKDPSGNAAGEQAMDVRLASGERKTLVQSVEILNPSLWSVEVPALYTCEISITSGKRACDHLTTTFGIRSIGFSAEKGFLLNGRLLKLKGGCVHHDNGLLGAASIDRAEERKVELLKANGFNAVRCAHNPPAEKFLEACDRLGLLVIDEAFDQWQKQKNPEDYHRFFDEWHERDLASMVLRDRNHPSIIMWSIGNEIQERADSVGMIITETLKNIVRQHDATRPVTAAVNDFWDNPKLKWKDSERAFRNLDVCGYNYMWWEYDNDIRLFPYRVLYGSESTAMERTINWNFVEKYPCIIGDFIWTAIDYLGESGIAHAMLVKDGDQEPPQFLGWPWFNGWCGDIDICGDSKPQSLLRDVLWGESKIEMAVHTPVPAGYHEAVSYWGWPDEYPSWNWTGYENQPLEVKVYSRYPSVRLYLNGTLLEEKKVPKGEDLPASDYVQQKTRYTAVFHVKYHPGELKAVGVDNGAEKESVTLHTTGKPAKIRLTADRAQLQASRNDLAYVKVELVDENGNVVPDSDRKIRLTASGAGKIEASGNASPTDMESFRSLAPQTYRGKALAIVRPERKPGTISLRASSEGLSDEEIIIEIK